MTSIATLDDLDRVYGASTDVSESATAKVAATVTPLYRRLIEASPFLAMATVGPEGLDCSPRGEWGGLVRVADERTLLLPDRRGNNRIDSLRNIVRDPRIAFLFLIPGSGSTLRVNGRAHVSIDPEMLASFEMDGKRPRSVVVATVEEVYFQCARAILRAELWNPAKHVDVQTLPTPGEILADMSGRRVGGAEYDRVWPERAQASLW